LILRSVRRVGATSEAAGLTRRRWSLGGQNGQILGSNFASDAHGEPAGISILPKASVYILPVLTGVARASQISRMNPSSRTCSRRPWSFLSARQSPKTDRGLSARPAAQCVLLIAPDASAPIGRGTLRLHI